MCLPRRFFFSLGFRSTQQPCPRTTNRCLVGLCDRGDEGADGLSCRWTKWSGPAGRLRAGMALVARGEFPM